LVVPTIVPPLPTASHMSAVAHDTPNMFWLVAELCAVHASADTGLSRPVASAALAITASRRRQSPSEMDTRQQPPDVRKRDERTVTSGPPERLFLFSAKRRRRFAPLRRGSASKNTPPWEVRMTSQAPAETKPVGTAVQSTAVEHEAVDDGAENKPVQSTPVEREAEASEQSAAPNHDGHAEPSTLSTPSSMAGAARPEHTQSRHRPPVVVARAMLRTLVLRLVRPITYATVTAAAVIALGVVFKVLDANTQKWLVSDVESAANWLATPFQNTFMLHSAKLAIALNWGIAIVVYAILGRVVARLMQRFAAQLARSG
jgi:hypothetical protein